MTGEIIKPQAKKLLKLARAAIASRLQIPVAEVTKPLDTIFHKEAATFVTLKIKGQLRGCIGSLEPTASLWESVRKNAEHAAFHDSRFMPLIHDEFEQLHIDISILTKPEPLEYRESEDLAALLRPHVDGVILRHGRAGATFLPQVWEQLPTPSQFLSNLCKKAGLPENFWRDGHPHIEIYQVQCFSEDEI